MPASFPRGRRLGLAVLCLWLAALAVLRAGDGVQTNAPGTPVVSADNMSSNTLRLWLEVPTNAAQTNLFGRSEMAATNLWLPPGRESLISTASHWRTTATIETGFFRCRDDGWPGAGRHQEDGWYQGVGVGVERDLIPGDSGWSVGLGVYAGRYSSR